jgi:flavin-dependent dehydrogenase
MTDTIETDVLIIGEGGAGQAAALTAREAGARVTLRPEQLGRRVPIAKGLVGDVQDPVR